MIAHQKSNKSSVRVDGDQPRADTNDAAKARAKRVVKLSARVIGVCAAIFVVLARDGAGPPYLDLAGKALFWTGMVLVPLFSFNYDVLRLKSGQLALVGLSALQLVLVVFSFERLKEVNFIILAPLCILQCLLFFLPLMLIRKRQKGIWY